MQCGNIFDWISPILGSMFPGWCAFVASPNLRRLTQSPFSFLPSSHVTSTHSSVSALTTSSSLTVSCVCLRREDVQALNFRCQFSYLAPSVVLHHQISNDDSSSGSGNLHAFSSSSSSSQVVNPSPSVPLAVSSSTTNGLHPSGAPGLTPNGTNTSLSASGSRTAPLLNTTSGWSITP